MSHVKSLQAKMKENKIDIYIISKTDPHISEYAEDYYSKQLKFLSGFTGSNGLIIATSEEIVFWSDGRYYTQGKMELEGSEIKFTPPLTQSVGEFITDYIKSYQEKHEGETQIGMDGRTFSVSLIKNIEKSLKNPYKLVDNDLLSQIWTKRPNHKSEEVYELAFELVGKNRSDKIKTLKKQMEDEKINSYFLSSLDDIAWLLNFRGNDIAFSPVFTSFLIIDENSVNLYSNNLQKFDKVKNLLAEDNINLLEEKELDNYLMTLENKTIALDVSKTAFAYYNKINESSTVKELSVDYVTKAKAIKNQNEINGTIIANKLFGTALIKTLYFADKFLNDETFKQNNLETARKYNENAELTEFAMGELLDDFCKKEKTYFSPSFPAISGYNENGAIIHYSPSVEKSKVLENKGTLLLDCGGHYFEGTTDVTRTICLGSKDELLPDFKKHYTLVLKGHIALSSAIFPSGTAGHNLDVLARTAIWQELLDYNHGTGHGLSHFLNVHEGPQGISQKPGSSYELLEGMLLTNEPGLYFTGKYGIRLENDIIIKSHVKNEYNDFLKFETVSLCHFDLDCIDVSMLLDNEKAWLNSYHKLVFDTISPNLDEDEKSWLKEKTREI